MSVTISELKENFGKTLIDDIIEIKEYIPYFTKATLVQQIANSCIETDEIGTSRIDYCKLDYMLDITMVRFYTDIEDIEFSEGDEVDNSIVGNYDFLKENKVIDAITGIASGDYYYLKEKIVDTVEQEISKLNSIESLIQGQVIKVVDKLTELLDEKKVKSIISHSVKQINKIDKNVLFGNGELIKSITDIFSKTDKAK